MTPLLTALSSWRDAVVRAARVASPSPDSATVRKLRTAVFSDERTLLLRTRAASFVRLRLIWDLMFATKQPRRFGVVWRSAAPGAIGGSRSAERTTPRDYQRAAEGPKLLDQCVHRAAPR